MAPAGKRVLAALVLIAALAGQASAGTLGRYTDAEREYLVYEPSQDPAPPLRPLLVYLHGCNQTVEDDAFIGGRFAEHADETGMVVALPEQTLIANGARCWNWFRPESQERDSGETAIIADITRKVIARFAIDPARVYVMGASAGGVMSANLGATYPDLYAAIGVLAGCPFRTCADATGLLAFVAMGERARAMPAFIATGTADPAAPYPLALASVSEWLGVADLADDGLLDLTISRQPASIEHRGLDQTPQPGSGDPCLPDGGPTRLPCLGGIVGFAEEYPHTIARWNDPEDKPLVELWTIHGGSHAIPAGDERGSFVDPLGPDVIGAALDFFARTGAPPP